MMAGWRSVDAEALADQLFAFLPKRLRPHPDVAPKVVFMAKTSLSVPRSIAGPG